MQFKLSSLFRWTTFVCISLVIFNRVIHERMDYDLLSTFLLPFYDILWLMNSDQIIQTTIDAQHSLLQRLVFTLGLFTSILLHSLVLFTVRYFLYGIKNEDS